MRDLNEYAFDITLKAAVRIKAPTEEMARQLLHEVFDCADCNFGGCRDNMPLTGEASLDGVPELYEVNGESP